MPSTQAERIAAARKHARLSQQALADAVGVSRPAVSQWESRLPSRTEPNSDNLRAVAAVTGAPLAWLMDDSVDPVPTWPAPSPVVNQRVSESFVPTASPSPAETLVPQASQSVEMDDAKLERSIQFLERQFALWGREFVASQHARLIARVYQRIGRPGESNLVQLSQWLASEIEGDEGSGNGTGGVRRAGARDR